MEDDEAALEAACAAAQAEQEIYSRALNEQLVWARSTEQQLAARVCRHGHPFGLDTVGTPFVCACGRQLAKDDFFAVCEPAGGPHRGAGEEEAPCELCLPCMGYEGRRYLMTPDERAASLRR